jgi:hypothetical protein
MKRHLEVKKASWDKFNKVMKKALSDIQAREKVFVAIRTQFEVNPYIHYFNDKVKDALFYVIFNIQLYAYLTSRLDIIQGLCKIV